MKRAVVIFLFITFCVVGSCYSSEVYLAHPGTGPGSLYYNGLIDYFNSQSDIDYTLSGMMPSNLSRYDLYMTYSLGDIPDYDYQYNKEEKNKLSHYLHSGGRVLLFSDHTGLGGPGKSIDPYLNSLLSELGSNMSLNGGLFDGGGHHNTIAGQILSNPFTNDVDRIRFAATNSINGGIKTFLTSNLKDCFFSYEKIGDGYLFLSGDYNIMDHAGYPDYDNGQFFRNLIEVPEPCSLILLGVGGMFLRRRKA